MEQQRLVFHAFVNGKQRGGEILYPQIAKGKACLKFITHRLKTNPDTEVFVDSIKVTYHNANGSIRTKVKGLFKTKVLRYIYRRKIDYNRIAHPYAY